MEGSEIEFIVVHISDSPHGRGDDASTIHRWHIERGWDGIGYHRVILENGVVENGRPFYWTGSHTYGYNKRSLAICMIGDGHLEPVQLSSLYDVIHLMLKVAPQAMVVGHHDLNKSKPCPMFDAKQWWLDFQK